MGRLLDDEMVQLPIGIRKGVQLGTVEAMDSMDEVGNLLHGARANDRRGRCVEPNGSGHGERVTKWRLRRKGEVVWAFDDGEWAEHTFAHASHFGCR